MQTNDSPPMKTATIASANRTMILIVVCFAAVITTFNFSALNVALPNINREFQADAVLLNWIIASFVLSIAIFSVPLGRIADIVGIKRVFIIGIFFFILPSITVIWANSAFVLIVIRFIQGIGSAMLGSAGTAMLTASYPGKQRGKALGIYSAFVYAGLSIGPLLGGVITEHLNWKIIFLVNIPVGLIILLLTLWNVKNEWAECRGEKFDYLGSLIYGLALAALMYGFSLLPELMGGIITLIGILGIITFISYENRNQSPILNVSLFKNNRAFIFSNLAALINYSATAGITFLISLYLQYNKGFSADQAGVILITQPIIQTILSPFAGRLSDRVEARLVSSIGMAMICLGLLFFGFLSLSTPIGLIIANLILLGAGFALFVPPNTNAIMSSVVPRYYAVGASVMGTMRTIGQTLSLGIIIIIMATVIGRVVIGPGNYDAFLRSAKIAFIIFAILCFFGIFASLARGRTDKGKSPGVQQGNHP